MCCTILAVYDLDKPKDYACEHLLQGRVAKGCSIYCDRPKTCREYQCVWTINDTLSDDWRPDRAGFLIHQEDERTLHIFNHVSSPEAWRRTPYYAQIKAWSRGRLQPGDTTVLAYERGQVFVVFPETEIEIGPPSNEFLHHGYKLVDGQKRPYAYYGPPPTTQETSPP